MRLHSRTMLGFLLTLGFHASALSQTDQILNVTVRHSFTEVAIEGVSVGLAQDGVTLSEATTDAQGQATFTVTVVSNQTEIPESGYGLGPVYPNPFTGRARVPLRVNRPGLITAAVYDALGRVVTSLDQNVTPGAFVFDADLAGLSSGSYFLAVQQDGQSIGTAQLVLNQSDDGKPLLRLVARASATATSLVGKFSLGDNNYELHFGKDSFVEQTLEIKLPDDLSVDAWLHVDPSSVVVGGLAVVDGVGAPSRLIVAHEDGSVAFGIGGDSLSFGILTHVDTTMVVAFNRLGLPEIAFVEDYLVLFDNYRETLVDVGIIPPAGDPVVTLDVEFGSLSKSTGTQGRLHALGEGLTVAACVLNSLALPLPACGSAVLEQMRTVEADSTSILASGAALSVGSALSCAEGRVSDCIVGATTLASMAEQAVADAGQEKASEIANVESQLLSHVGSYTLVRVNGNTLPTLALVTIDDDGVGCEEDIAIGGRLVLNRDGTFLGILDFLDSEDAKVAQDGTCQVMDQVLLVVPVVGDYQIEGDGIQFLNVLLDSEPLPDLSGTVVIGSQLTMDLLDVPEDQLLVQFEFDKD